MKYDPDDVKSTLSLGAGQCDKQLQLKKSTLNFATDCLTRLLAKR